MIIITGATSFVGQRVIQQLSKYYDVSKALCLTWNKDQTTRNRVVEERGREIMQALGVENRDVDLVTREGLSDLPSDAKLIIHLAANTNTSDPDQRCNDEGTVNLIEALPNLGSDVHFVYISTIAFMAGRTDCNHGINEQTMPVPTNEYGRTKLRAEKYLIKKCKEKNIKLTVVRLNTVYGNGSRPDSMFDLLVKWVKENSIIARLNWPGLTSIVNVEDVARVILMLSKLPPKPGSYEIYTVYGQSLTLAQISEEIYRGLNKKYEPINLPSWIWKGLAGARRFVPYLEGLLLTNWYNSIWRIGLIVDDVVYCETDKIVKRLPMWKPKKLADVIDSVVA